VSVLYPFTALVGQETLRLALLISAVDPALGALLRGDKGAAKSTAARALAELLPDGAPFVNLPVGASEDRLLGGLDLERALQGESALKPGLLAQAHGGVLYCDEVNLLPAHLIDALLDAASSGVNVLERDGFSVQHPARFVLLGSMNPEEGTLRPQLLDRFALVAEVHAPTEACERREILVRRLKFDADPEGFRRAWAAPQEALKDRLTRARAALLEVHVSPDLLTEVAATVCRHGVTSLRADLALVRAARAHAALDGRPEVMVDDVATVLPLVLAHRVPPGSRLPDPPRAPEEPASRGEESPAPVLDGSPDTAPSGSADESPAPVQEQVFAPGTVFVPQLMVSLGGPAGRQPAPTGEARGRVVHVRPDRQPRELDVRASLKSALTRSGSAALTPADLHGRVRESVGGRVLLLLLDASGSHAQGERMRAVKGASLGLIDTLRGSDLVALIAFRGAGAELLCPPTREHSAARRAMDYLPTGGRTPLAHALQLAEELLGDLDLSHGSTLVLFTDGRANLALRGTDPWQDALDAAVRLRAGAPDLSIRVIDTEQGPHRLGRAQLLSGAMGATLTPLEDRP
jgi:magnesium chelatase subunit D